MKRTFAIAVLLCGLCTTIFATIFSMLPTPQDDPAVRSLLRDHADQFKPLAVESQEVCRKRLWRLDVDETAKIFGPRLDTAKNPGLLKYPTNLVMPGFGFGLVMVDGLHHTDLHAVGDIGYIQFFYRTADGEKYGQTPAIYFRADDKFVPLKSTNDLPKRLEWDTAKLKAFEKWLDEHLPAK